MSQNRVPSQSPFILRIVSGKDKGIEYRLISAQISLGRAENNTIVLDDPKVSRNHAMIYVTPEGIQLTNISNGNAININGVDIDNAIVPNGSIIKIGTMKLELIDERVSSNDIAKRMENRPMVNRGLEGLSSTSGISAPPEENKMPILIGGVILVGLIIFLLSGGDKETNETIRHESVQQVEIEQARERQNQLIRAREAQGKNTLEYREAQSLYIQGFRDYREGNYSRAIDYFNGSLALYPQHALSRRYLNQSKTKLDELIQITLLEANRHFEKKQYKRASAKYKQVMILIDNKNDTTYKEARTRYNETLHLIRGSY